MTLCLLTRDRKQQLILGVDFNFPPNLWQDLSFHGGSLWIHKLGASVVTPEGSTHTCRTGMGQKPDIIDYFLVSTLIRPLRQKCEVVQSVTWCQHHGTKVRAQHRLRIGSVSRQLIGKICKRSHHSTHALQEIHDTDQTEKAHPTLWDEARRKCVFEGRKPGCQDRQEAAKSGILPKYKRSWFPGRGRRVRPRFWRPGVTPRLNTG